jgi:hypothetical protein
MIRAEVAQLVEHSPEKAGVDSSILSLGTISFPQFTCGFLPLWHYRLSIVSAHFRQRGNLPSFCDSRHMGGHLSSRLLTKSTSSVLAALRGSTYCREYASPLRLLRPCWTAFLNSLRRLLTASVSIRVLRVCHVQVVCQRPASPVEVELVHISGLPELPFAIRSRKLHE